MNKKIIKDLIIGAKKKSYFENIFSFNLGEYIVCMCREGSMWRLAIQYKFRYIFDRYVNVVPVDYRPHRWSKYVVECAAEQIVKTIEEFEKNLAA